MRVRPGRRLRPVAADDQPSPEGAARIRPARPGEARRLGVLLGADPGAVQSRRADRRSAAVSRSSLPGVNRYRRLTMNSENEPVDRATAAEYATWFRALADPSRIQIVSLLA